MSRSSVRFLPSPIAFVVAVVLALGVFIGMIGARGAQSTSLSTTLTVTTTKDSGTGSLRAAIGAAQPGDRITFAVSGVITSSQYMITKPLTIDGPGAAVLTIRGTPTQVVHGGVFNISVSGTVVISGVTIAAGDAYVSNGQGGAIYNGASGNLLIDSCVIRDSRADGGGGVYTSGPLTIRNSSFILNTASGGGGGVHSDFEELTIENSQFLSNTSYSGSGGVQAVNADLKGVLIQNNSVTSAWNGVGGLSLAGSGNIVDSQFLTNSGRYAGGVNQGAIGHVYFNNTQFVNNYGGSGGGGASLYSATLRNTLFQNNHSTTAGGGLYAKNGVIVTGSRFTGNTANDGGGIYADSDLNLSATLLTGNLAARGGGGLVHASGNAVIINSLFARDTAALSGPAVSLNSTGLVQLTHVTVGSPILANGTAVKVLTGTVYMADVIIANHFIGLQIGGGTIAQDYNLFYSNLSDIIGTASGGTHNVSADPKFVNAAQDNYHLSVGSAAIDKGVNLGITTDIDGDQRPYGNGFDIGYDEYVQRYVYVPMVSR